jgi:hypothetical protein
MEMTMNREEKIKARAYELYKAGGPHPKSDLENWLQAEKEITQQMKQQPKGGVVSEKKNSQPRSKVM